jgi:uncharacterized membrane protein
MTSMRRILRHLVGGRWRVRRAFPPPALQRIHEAISLCEGSHGGQIRFAVEDALDLPDLLGGQSARERALEVFGELRVWDTERNNGVLVYFLLADRDFEIVGDRGIHVHVGAAGWEDVARRMEELIRDGDFEGGVLWGIGAIGALLRRHFPPDGTPGGELPDEPVIV